MFDQNIVIPYQAVAAFCQRHHIRKLSLFGSVLRDDFRPDSDVDVLVEFEEGYTPGWEFVSMGSELSEILRRKVDFLTEGFLSRHFRRKVHDLAQVVYERP